MPGLKTQIRIYLEKAADLLGELEKRVERLELDAEQRRQAKENRQRYGLTTDERTDRG